MKRVLNEQRQRSAGADLRARLLQGVDTTERRLNLAGISTPILESGDGPPVILLHEQGEFGASWARVIPRLAMTNRVIVPDLPGHGTTEVSDGPLDPDRVFAWLSELIEHTCFRRRSWGTCSAVPSPPATRSLTPIV